MGPFSAATCLVSPVSCLLSCVTCHLFTTRHSLRPCLTLRLCFPIYEIKPYFLMILEKVAPFCAATCHVSSVNCHLSPVTCHLLTTRHSVRPCLTLWLCFPISQIKIFSNAFRKIGAISHVSLKTCQMLHFTCYMSPVTCHLTPATCHLTPLT